MKTAVFALILGLFSVSAMANQLNISQSELVKREGTLPEIYELKNATSSKLFALPLKISVSQSFLNLSEINDVLLGVEFNGPATRGMIDMGIEPKSFSFVSGKTVIDANLNQYNIENIIQHYCHTYKAKADAVGINLVIEMGENIFSRVANGTLDKEGKTLRISIPVKCEI